MNKPMFTAGADVSYAELPVEPAYLRWVRGNAQLRAIAKTDPAQFLGGWRAMVNNREGEALPALPFPIVERMSEDGTLTFNVYASPVVEFLPIQHRTRFELREKKKDPQTGREKNFIKAVSKKRADGFQPMKQVFGLALNGVDIEHGTPTVLILDKWSSFITFNKAEQKWARIKLAADKALVRRYGTEGINEGGKIVPEFEVYGDSRSTPIQAIGLDNPRVVAVNDYLTKLYYDSQEWADCPRWNADGEVNESVSEPTVKERFLEACNAMYLTNIEIEQILAENDGDYAKALDAVEGGLATVNMNE
jgi:hypothetical protein